MDFTLEQIIPIAIVAITVFGAFFMLNTSKFWRHLSSFRYGEIATAMGAIYIVTYIALSYAPVIDLPEALFYAIAIMAAILNTLFLFLIAQNKTVEEVNFKPKKQYRVFDEIDLLKTYAPRVGKKPIKWNMQGDEAKPIENFDTDALEDEVGGLKKIIKNDIGYPVGIALNQVVKSNIARLKEDFIDVLGYPLTVESKLRKIDRYIIEKINEVHAIYTQLGDFDINEQIVKMGSVELAILDGIDRISKAKIPVNFTQLIAVTESDRDRDLLGAIQNIQNEKMVQRSGIYLYAYYLVRKKEITK